MVEKKLSVKFVSNGVRVNTFRGYQAKDTAFQYSISSV